MNTELSGSCEIVPIDTGCPNCEKSLVITMIRDEYMNPCTVIIECENCKRGEHISLYDFSRLTGRQLGWMVESAKESISCRKTVLP